jgi:polynucleotide 5'-hydroxyl-kinase GRC3/NOL9
MPVIDFIVPPQWADLAAKGLRGTVMIVGASDTGKSTLACYLFQKLSRHGLHAGYLDADVGQSTLGLPTTLNLALSTGAGDDRFPPQGSQITYFVGATTPRGHMLPTVIGAYRLQQRARTLGAEVIVVDTTGLVDRAQGGKALKQWKIELLAPDVVIGLQRGRELEPILWPLRRDKRVRCVELSVSPHVVERSRKARIAWRCTQLARYLEAAQPKLVELHKLPVYDLERLAGGTLLAFQDADGFALGLGVVQEANRREGTALVHTPLLDLEGVASVRLGKTRWDWTNRREL